MDQYYKAITPIKKDHDPCKFNRIWPDEEKIGAIIWNVDKSKILFVQESESGKWGPIKGYYTPNESKLNFIQNKIKLELDINLNEIDHNVSTSEISLKGYNKKSGYTMITIELKQDVLIPDHANWFSVNDSNYNVKFNLPANKLMSYLNRQFKS